MARNGALDLCDHLAKLRLTTGKLAVLSKGKSCYVPSNELLYLLHILLYNVAVQIETSEVLEAFQKKQRCSVAKSSIWRRKITRPS